MDKLLVFTNYNSGFNLPKIEDKTEWHDSYPDKRNPIVLCRYNGQEKGTVLESIDCIQEEGIYLVYDEIERSILDDLLNECEQENDRICVLTHSNGNYSDLNYFKKWKNIYPLRGMHIARKEFLYEPIFDIIIDPNEKNKMNRIINTFFLPEVILNFLNECLVTKKDLKNTTSYHFLFQGGFDNDLNLFMEIYENSKSLEDYQEDLNRLKKSLFMSCQK